MTPTPISASHQIDFHYKTNGLAHVLQLRCHATPSGGSYDLASYTGTNLPWTVNVDNFVTVLKPLFKASQDNIEKAVLQEYDGGTYNPLEEYSIGVDGTGTSGRVVAGQFTLMYRDAAFKRLKIVLMEPALGDVPIHQGYGGIGGALLAFVDDTKNVSSGHAGAWIRSRIDSHINQFIDITGSLNKKTRRRRGLV